jgi:hypothetical protein
MAENNVPFNYGGIAIHSDQIECYPSTGEDRVFRNANSRVTHIATLPISTNSHLSNRQPRKWFFRRNRSGDRL